MAAASELAKLHGAEALDQALEAAAEAGRFGSGDLASILAHRRAHNVIELPRRTPEAATLQHSTAAWEGFGK